LRGGGYNASVLFVQCASCGTVIGVLDYFNATRILREIDAKVDKILDQV
jgi:DNA-directed RNA polymerase subunit N (RpoN/RPB10)